MKPNPVKRYRPRSRNRALGDGRATELREKALKIAEGSLRQKTANHRGGPVDHGSPAKQQQAAEQMKNKHAQVLGEMERQKQIQGRKPQTNQVEGRRSFSLSRNNTGNERSGQLFRTIQKSGGEIHEYQSGKRVFVRDPTHGAKRETGPTGGTYNRGLKPSGGSATMGELEKLARRRVTEDRPNAKRRFASAARYTPDQGKTRQRRRRIIGIGNNSTRRMIA